jgi:uncharacterized membrane protein
MKKQNLYRLTAAAMLVALEVILAFTPLGYLKIGLLSITFMTIPIIIGSLTAGATAATILGLTFGITSFVQCFGMDMFGTTLFQISPVYTFITCVGARTLMGFLCGVIFKGLNKTKLPETVRGGIAAFSAPFLNTLFFMACLIGFFWNTEYIQSIAAGANVFKFLITIVGINGIVEWIVCTVVGTAVGVPVARAVRKIR